jgi:hypothetical protein
LVVSQSVDEFELSYGGFQVVIQSSTAYNLTLFNTEWMLTSHMIAVVNFLGWLQYCEVYVALNTVVVAYTWNGTQCPWQHLMRSWKVHEKAMPYRYA